jgi:SAM-dependent methyltransferase
MLRRKERPRPDKAPAATERELLAAYRLLLGREPDSAGLAHYRQRIRDGMSLEELLRTFIDSDEYREHEIRDSSAEGGPIASPAATDHDVIEPADVIRRYSIQQLAETADEYYRRVTDPAPLMAKPFAFLHEAPEMLMNLGQLLAGLELGKGMTVLDFGAGTCWLSRVLAQFGCQTISCDVSRAALQIGQRLFEEHPIIGGSPFTPRFLPFEGERIDLPDASVDRIVCFDTFHHVPNPEQVIREFGRVLKTGGLAGFSEPGAHHSRSPQAQYEMRHHRVLENDIDLTQLSTWATEGGFTAVTARVLADRELPLEDYVNIRDGRLDERGRRGLVQSIRDSMAAKSVFFLHKGVLTRDSRSHIGLRHELVVSPRNVTLGSESSVRLNVRVSNTGDALWLNEGKEIFGLVRLAAHLYSEREELLEVDYFRQPLPAVAPGDTIEFSVDVPVPPLQRCRLEFDLVSEGVIWFENAGSKTVPVIVTRSRMFATVS